MDFDINLETIIEYGAALGHSALHQLYSKDNNVNNLNWIVTEYRTKDQLKNDYKIGFNKRLTNLKSKKKKKYPNAKVYYKTGVNSTLKNNTKLFGKVSYIRFTNPNMGDEDLKDESNELNGLDGVSKKIKLLLKKNTTDIIKDGYMILNISKIDKTNDIEIRKLVETMSRLRNQYLLFMFFKNTYTNIINFNKSNKKQTIIELILKPKFFNRWQVNKIAEKNGFKLIKKKTIILPHIHLRTKKYKKVGHQKQKDFIYYFKMVKIIKTNKNVFKESYNKGLFTLKDKKTTNLKIHKITNNFIYPVK